VTRPRLTRVATFVVVAGFVVGTGGTGPGSFAQLPLQIDLKDRFALMPAAMAAFFAVTGLVWNFKPLASVLMDVFPIGGSRRRAYLALAVGGALVSWTAFALVPSSLRAMVTAGLGVEVSLMLASVVLGAILVEAGQKDGATGRLTSLRLTAIFVGGIAAGPIGGWLATRPLWCTATLALALQGVLLTMSLTCVDEPRITERPRAREAIARLGAALKSRPLLLSAFVGFLVLAEPGFGTPLLYVQTQQLGQSSQFVGFTRMSESVAAACGGLLYGLLCRRIRLRGLLVGGVVVHALGALLFLALDRPTWQAIAIFAVSGACSSLVISPLWDLSARAAPAGFEGLAYALMMSALNAAQSASDVLGSVLYDRWNVGFRSLVWLNSLSTLAALFVLPLLPASLLDRADRVGPAPS
jgi:predicted MFS family arabinose efflux permease